MKHWVLSGNYWIHSVSLGFSRSHPFLTFSFLLRPPAPFPPVFGLTWWRAFIFQCEKQKQSKETFHELPAPYLPTYLCAHIVNHLSLLRMNSSHSYLGPITCALDSIWICPLKDSISVILLCQISVFYQIIPICAYYYFFWHAYTQIVSGLCFPLPASVLFLFLYSQSPWKNGLYSPSPTYLLLLSLKPPPVSLSSPPFIENSC